MKRSGRTSRPGRSGQGGTLGGPSALQGAGRTARSSRNDWIGFRDQSLYLIRDLMASFIAFLGVPDDLVDFLPPAAETEPGKTYTLARATRVQSDGFWHLRICINPEPPPEDEPAPRVSPAPVVLPFRIRKEKSGFRIRIGDLADFTVDPSDDEDYHAIYDKHFALVKHFIDTYPAAGKGVSPEYSFWLV
jgi:hypothetical protein